MLQINPPLPLDTPKGPGLAHFVIDLGCEHNLLWVVAQDDTGECWTWDNSKVRFQKNIMMGRIVDNKYILGDIKAATTSTIERQQFNSGLSYGIPCDEFGIPVPDSLTKPYKTV